MNSVISPPGVIRPIAAGADCANHTFPPVPAAIPCSWAPDGIACWFSAIVGTHGGGAHGVT